MDWQTEMLTSSYDFKLLFAGLVMNFQAINFMKFGIINIVIKVKDSSEILRGYNRYLMVVKFIFSF